MAFERYAIGDCCKIIFNFLFSFASARQSLEAARWNVDTPVHDRLSMCTTNLT
jgi:hypothetical protein